jgi:hypothetical protein
VTIECPHCNARVEAKVIAAHDDEERFDFANCENIDLNELDYDLDKAEAVLPYRATLLVCVICHNALLAFQYNKGGEDWTLPKRVYPPERTLSLPRLRNLWVTDAFGWRAGSSARAAGERRIGAVSFLCS